MVKVVVITGQTATGKTKLALKYAKELRGELVSCDSRHIYKKIDIVTGKDKNLLKENRVHLYDVVDPKNFFSSFDYQKLALKEIEKILKKGKTPIIVGGTYLYLSHLLYGFNTHGIPPDIDLREKLDKKSVKELQLILKKLSLDVFNKLNESDKKNPRRLIRKIEIASFYSSSIITKNNSRQARTINKYKIIGLRFKNRSSLEKAIEKRVEKRVEQGAFEEVKKLIDKGYSENDPGLKTIGCQQIIKFYKGKLAKQEAIREWVVKEIQYARRQYIFMKKDKNIKWRIVD